MEKVVVSMANQMHRCRTTGPRRCLRKGRVEHQAGKILTPELDIQGHPFVLWGDRKSADRGDFVLLELLVDSRCLPLRSPGAFEVGDEQKAALIKENQVGAKPLGFFLYGAILLFSSVRWLLRPVAGPGAPVSGNSNPSSPGASRHGRGDTEPRNACRSPRSRALRSRDPSGNRRPGVP